MAKEVNTLVLNAVCLFSSTKGEATEFTFTTGKAGVYRFDLKIRILKLMAAISNSIPVVMNLIRILLIIYTTAICSRIYRRVGI